jgi:asparagine synthase (glutamine-hydrolysing)
MCRIFGYVSNNYKIEDSIINKVKMVQIAGGPDEQSICRISDNALIANNRLSLQDILHGQQPFILNNVYAVFNGEIYNHLELKYYLTKKGYTFTSNADGEIIIPLYLEYGLDFVKHLDGMFCVSLYDNNIKKLILITDHLAIKSIYYSKTQHAFYFSSDIKGIHAFNIPGSKEYSELNIDNYLVGRCIWGGDTFFDNIKVMKPKQIMIVDHQLKVEIFEYRVNASSNIVHYDIHNSAIYLHNLMENEISNMLKADVPSCVVLSGGLDSSYIAALIKRQVDNLDTFHVCYDVNWNNDERQYAALVSKAIGANHHEVSLNANDMILMLDHMVNSLGIPNTAPHSLAAFGLYKHISDYGYKIAFAGEGSDEIFCGYKRFSEATFNQSPNWINEYFNLFSINNLDNLRKYYSKEYTHFIQGISTYDKYFMKQFKNVNAIENRISKLLDIEQNLRFPNYILRRTDHLSMAFSLEIRVPFCQQSVLNFANSLPTNFKLDVNNQKKILFQAATGIVPQEIIHRKKQPFTLPVLNILKSNSNFKDYIIDNIIDNCHLKKYFDTNKILHDINGDMDNKQADVIWAILVLGLWIQKNV